MRRFFSLMFATAITTILPATPLGAQIVDYAALGDTFGEPITTGVTGQPQRTSEAPASITIITRDQIARSSARTVPDMLKAYAGVDASRWTAGQSDVFVRGSAQTNNASLLVLVDGRQVYLDHFGATNWNFLGVQIDEIQQIELVRGPASALYGFNAASGVVNIITARANGPAHAAATAEIGTRGYSRLGGSVTMPVAPSVGLKISGGAHRENERVIPAGLYQPPVRRDVRSEQASATLAIQAAPSTLVEINGGLGQSRQLEFMALQFLAEQRFRNRTLGMRINHDTDWGSVDGHAYTNHLNVQYGRTSPPNERFSNVASFHLRNRITVLEGAALVRLGPDNMLRVGAEYRNNQLSARLLFSERIGYEVVAISGMLDLHPAERIAITGAARADHLRLIQRGTPALPQVDPASAYDRTITPVSFNAAVTVQTGESGHFRLNGGRGFQLPSIVGLGLRVPVPAPEYPVPVFMTGDPALDPVTVWSGEASYGHSLRSGVQLDATFFYTRSNGLTALPIAEGGVTLQFLPQPTGVMRFANVGSLTSYGVELSASGKLTSALRWSANYSWIRVQEDIPANRDVPNYATYPEAATPRHRANLGFDYVDGRWFATGLAHFTTGSRQGSFVQTGTVALIRVPGALGIDMKIGRQLTPTLSAYVAGENLGNGRGVYTSPVPADRRLRVGLSLDL